MSAAQQQSRRLTKHPPQQLPPSSSSKPHVLSKRKEGSSNEPTPTVSNSPLPSPRHQSPPRHLSKRHASFESPREVPMPSPSHHSQNSNQQSYFPPVESEHQPKSRPSSMSKRKSDIIFEEQMDEPGWTHVTKGDSGGHENTALHPINQPSSSSSPATTPGIIPSHIHPYPRPYSVPHSSSDQSSADDTPATSESFAAPSPKSTPMDRNSSASLPLPSQIPFHALPKVGSRSGAGVSNRAALDSLVGEIARSSVSETQEDVLRPHMNSSDPPNSSGSSSSLQSAVSHARSMSSHGRLSNSGPHLGYSPRTSYPESSSLSSATALRRSTPSMSSSNFPPPEPPTILPSLDAPSSLYSSMSDRFSTSSSSTASSRLSTETSLTSPNSSDCSSSPPFRSLHSTRPQASEPPYAPFLSHAPPPADSWIEVETTPSEYRLNVKLPGFQRDGITLATKKRRILHVVADSWGTGGGHFERRISFGYDADLVQVRAEFDGDMLRVIVPRRALLPSGAGAGAGMGYAM